MRCAIALLKSKIRVGEVSPAQDSEAGVALRRKWLEERTAEASLPSKNSLASITVRKVTKLPSTYATGRASQR